MTKMGAYRLDGRTIHKEPVETKNADGSSNIALGFPVCTASEWVDPEVVLNILEANERIAQIEDWAELGPKLLEAAKDARERLECIAFMGMTQPVACGPEPSASFYKSRAYDAIATAENGLDLLPEAIAACEAIGGKDDG